MGMQAKFHRLEGEGGIFEPVRPVPGPSGTPVTRCCQDARVRDTSSGRDWMLRDGQPCVCKFCHLTGAVQYGPPSKQTIALRRSRT